MFFQKFTVSFSSLHLLKEKERGIITSLTGEAIDKLESIGIKPGLMVTIEQKFPDLIINMENNWLRIDEKIAKLIRVKLIS